MLHAKGLSGISLVQQCDACQGITSAGVHIRSSAILQILAVVVAMHACRTATPVKDLGHRSSTDVGGDIGAASDTHRCPVAQVEDMPGDDEVACLDTAFK